MNLRCAEHTGSDLEYVPISFHIYIFPYCRQVPFFIDFYLQRNEAFNGEKGVLFNSNLSPVRTFFVFIYLKLNLEIGE